MARLRRHGPLLTTAAALLLAAGCVDEAASARQTLAEADRLREEGRIAQASARYEAATERDPSLAPAYGALAAIRLEQERYAQARRLAERAAELAPNEPDHHETLGMALVALEQWEQARAALLQTLSLDPEREHLQRLLGRARLETGDREGARRAWKRALEVDPHDLEARLSLAELLVTELEEQLATRDDDGATPSSKRAASRRAELQALRNEARAVLAPVDESLSDERLQARIEDIEQRLDEARAGIEEAGALQALGNLQGPALGQARGFGGLGLGTSGTPGSASGGATPSGRVGLLRALAGSSSGAPSGPSMQVTTHGYSQASARRVARRNRGALQACYALRRARRPGLRGAVVASVEVDGSGRVTAVTARDDGIGDTAVVQCVRALVHGWRFPPPSSPTTVDIRLDYAP